MITLWTDKFKISDPAEKTADIIQEYQKFGCVTINLSIEGPSADHIGIYKLLDYVCNKFNFDKNKITILTGNFEEHHPEYTIRFQKLWHLPVFYTNIKEKNWRGETFVNKDLSKNLFACFYNIPAWDRMCLLSYIKFNTKHNSLLTCNGVVTGRQYNSYALDNVLEQCPNELENIMQLIRSNIGPLSNHPTPGTNQKPHPNSQLDVITYYNEFFVDMVGETYIHGLTFYPTEKIWRPIFASTPFIVSGPQGYLENLKARYNIKTFSKWWDESYDTYQNYKRIEHIYKVIDFLDSLTVSERKTMYAEMESILRHNYKTIFKNTV